MTILALEPGQRIDAAWAERARAASDDERARLLARADELREGEGSDVALACYRALRDDLDPPRLTWLLRRASGADPELQDVVRRAADSTPGEDLWVFGQYRLAEYERVEGRVSAAIQRLHDVLRCAEGQDDSTKGLVAANLAICLRQQERNVESFVVAQSAIAALARADQVRIRLHTQYVVAFLYASFHDWPRYERLVAEIEDESKSLPSEERSRLERVALRVRAGAALEHGHFEDALDYLARLERIHPDRGPVLAVMRAFALTRLGRGAEARTILDELRAVEQPIPWLALRMLTTETLCSIALDPLPQALNRVVAFLERLTTSRFDSSGGRAKMLVHVARDLADKPGLAPLAERAYALAAECYVRRIRELDRFSRTETPSTELDPETRRVLGELHARLSDSRLDVMMPIARLLDEARRRGDAVPTEWYDEQGVLTVCAWCASLRRPDGTWTPVGVLVPSDPRLQVTHAMCPPCHASATHRPPSSETQP